MPSDVDRYFEEVKQGNPSYSDAQVWATAWSIFCKHKDPGSDHCKKDQGEYLKGKSAMVGRLALRALTASFYGSSLDAFRAEVQKDAEAGVKWLAAFEHQALGELSTFKDTLLRAGASPALEAFFGKAEEAIKNFAKHGTLMARDELTAAAGKLKDPGVQGLVAWLRKTEGQAERFTDRLYGKYDSLSLVRTRDVLAPEDKDQFNEAFEGFRNWIFDRPFAVVMRKFAEDLRK